MSEGTAASVLRLTAGTNRLTAVMIFVDFSDVRATESTVQLRNRLVPNARAWYAEASFGRATLDVTPIHRWFRWRAAPVTTASRTGSPSRSTRTTSQTRSQQRTRTSISRYRIVYIVAARGSALQRSLPPSRDARRRHLGGRSRATACGHVRRGRARGFPSATAPTCSSTRRATYWACQISTTGGPPTIRRCSDSPASGTPWAPRAQGPLPRLAQMEAELDRSDATDVPARSRRGDGHHQPGGGGGRAQGCRGSDRAFNRVRDRGPAPRRTGRETL